MIRKISFDEMRVIISGGVYMDRLPGRGITVRREYRPFVEVISEYFSLAAKEIIGVAIACNTACEVMIQFSCEIEKYLREDGRGI